MKKCTLKCILPLIFFLLSIVACEKDKSLTEGPESFYYEETSCADPWRQINLSSDEKLKLEVPFILRIL